MPVHLIASSDDFLLEEKLREIVAVVAGDLDGVDPEEVADDVTPERLAVELCSPSLFAAQRVLVLPEIRSWVDVPARRQPTSKPAEVAVVDPDPVVQVLGEGLSEDIALVLGACCHSKPKGALVDAVEETGHFHWQPAPEPPKPWEDVVLSKEQEAVLRGLLAKTAGDIRFTPEAERLLLDRLGFAPRLLVQEARKLAAANVAGVVNEELVLALSFPRERSFDVVLDAIFDRRAAPILDLMAAADTGIPVRDRQGRAVSTESVGQILLSQISSILQNLLYLKRLAAANGLSDEMSPERTGGNYWYPRQFKNGLGPKLMELIKADAPSPILRGRPPTLFALGGLFKGAGRYSDDELVDALASLGATESALRGDMSREGLSVWLTSFLH